MAEITTYTMENKLGCGLTRGAFLRRLFWPRKTSVHSLPAESSTNITSLPSFDSNSKRQQNKPEPGILYPSNFPKSSSKNWEKNDIVWFLQDPRLLLKNKQGRRPSDAARNSASSASSSGRIKVFQTDRAELKRDSASDSIELSSRNVMANHQKSNDSKALVRATSGNAMLSGNLGNLRQSINGSFIGNNSPNATIKTVDYLHKNLQKVNFSSRPRNGYSKLGTSCVMGNIVRQPSDEFQQGQGLIISMDPEVLKNRGNERYKQGRFEEALAFYDRAIARDSTKATYRSNRSAALIGLGRLIEAVAECKEAIRLDPSYQRAHYRLATIYFRLGETQKALSHYEQSGPIADSEDLAQAHALEKNLNRCTEARKLEEWSRLLKETERAISFGADSAPQVFAMQAEALLRLHRHQEAYTAYQKGPNFSADSCAKFFGSTIASYLLVTRARVYMAAGRFEDAIATAQQAARLDPSNRVVSTVVKSAKAVASARLSGNLLFKASKFTEACIAYSEGLEHEPCNSILLCNRAACRFKLGQFEKAIEDCTAALSLQPSYSKARLRRAHCNAELGRWEASIQDFEMLIRESPADEEVGRALFEAQVQLKKQRGEDTQDLKFGSNLVFVSCNERFRHFVTSPGMAVVLFCGKESDQTVWQLMQQVSKKFPSVNFLKVEVEDHPYLAKSERVTLLPSFKIYKNGSRVKEIPGNHRELLEKSVKLYSR
ncbi:TPR REPEAT-CONTAINING THIOREDOXIN [Salix koriyanagi]|uniref:TPR REPEAT-CONTAINING THIOREDOXIN n=1 Tax=Salix koriyanagi TaxID=2511006 RepID=A0A9Q0P535_9ROSI|nr:TPR REPEAT-CONTAINING THIOREDOXIN [Salix koriyanagi]